MGFFERYLSLWVALCIGVGVSMGLQMPALFQGLAELQISSVNLPIAVLIWLMIFPMLLNVDFSSIKQVGKNPKPLVITLLVNWLIKPFSMAALAILFFEYVFADLISPQSAKEYTAGLILLGVAPCTAMVFVWSYLVKGDANYTLVQVSLNDLIMLIAFAPIAAMLLGVSDIVVPWETLLLSSVLYIVFPLCLAYLTRRALLQAGGESSLTRFIQVVKPFSVCSLLLMLVLLFAFQAHSIVSQPVVIALIAVPLVIQSYTIFVIAFSWAYLWKVPFATAAPAALIGTSNFFELAVAVAIGMFGVHSGAALATVVGVLVEVPVMLSLVALANKLRPRFS